MTERHVLDFRVGTPWTDATLRTFHAAAAAAWADHRHPASEGRRAASWLEAAQATVRTLTGVPHVAFFPDRDAALTAALHLFGGQSVVAAATHRARVLEQVDLVAPVDGAGVAHWSEGDVVVLQGANEETGVVDVYRGAAARLLDASATFGRSDVDLAAGPVVADAAAWGSPAPCALLLSTRALPPQGSIAVPEVVVAIDALERCWGTMAARSRAEQEAMASFEARVSREVPDVAFHGEHRVGHIRSLSVLHLDGETLMRALDARGFVVGSGSACVQDGRPSHVLAAMGALTHGNLRMALPVGLDLTVLDDFATILRDTVQQLRHEAGVDQL